MDVGEALVIELGLDNRKFMEGQKTATAEFDRTRGQMLRDADEIEKQLAKKFEEAMGRVTKSVMAFFGIFLAARGIADFVENTTRAEVSLGLISAAMGVAPDKISAFEIAVQRMGGKAGEASAALSAFNKMVIGFQQEGTPASNAFAAIGGGSIDMTKGDQLDRLIQIADLLEKYHADKSTKSFLLGEMGFSGLGAQQFLLQGGQKVREQLGRAAGSATTQEQVDAGDRLNAAFLDARNAIIAFGREAVKSVEPLITPLLAGLAKWVNDFRPMLVSWVSDKVLQLKAFVDGGGLEKIGDWLVQIAEKVKAIVDSLGGWGEATKDLFAIWVVSSLTPILSLLIGMAGLFLGADAPMFMFIAALEAILVAYKAIFDSGATSAAQAATTPPAGSSSDPSGVASSTDDITENNPLPVTMKAQPGEEDTIFGLFTRLIGKVVDAISHAVSGASAATAGLNSHDITGVTPANGGELDFMTKIYNAAKASGDPFPELTAAQAADETGQGKHFAGANNLFGQRTTAGPFASYPSEQASIDARKAHWMKLYAKAKTVDEAFELELKAGYVMESERAEYRAGVGGYLRRFYAAHPELLKGLPASGSAPAASDAAAAQRQSMNATKKTIAVAGVTVHSPSASSTMIAKDIRVALQRELSNNFAMG